MKIVLKPGHADLQILPGRWADPNMMVQAASAAGLKPRADDIRVSAVGTVRVVGDNLFFTLSRMKTTTVLVLRVPEGEKDSALLTELQQKTRSPGTLVEIEGLWQPWNGAVPAAAARSSQATEAVSPDGTAKAGAPLRPVGILTVTRVRPITAQSAAR